jgi:hypothetical protein
MSDPRVEKFEYSFGSLFITLPNAISEDVGWTENHERQGFSRGPGVLQFATLTQFGSAELVLKVQQCHELSDFERVIQVPFEIQSRKVKIGSIECANDPIIVDLEPGCYKVVVAQKLIDEDEIGAGREAIEICFEQLESPLKESKILVCDSGLNPPNVLLETY